MIKLLILLISVSTFAQESDGINTFDYTRGIYKKVQSLDKIRPEEYRDKLFSVRKEIIKYIKHKKGVCEGNYSTIILNEKKQDDSEYKLSKQEQELCYRELKGLQLNYLNKVFTAKRNYLIYLHEMRLEGLDTVRSESLKNLQATFDKKILRKKSRVRKRRRRKKKASL